ncbi:hypothetical protein EGW08_009152 [Elysia chlorotica]|uniref:FZ domain-containing protein n=1 Tax=Elysia chlorotica TaxID=188477 RepID=A0A3S1BKS6_ELYCH|nr:hypothetical protein EGW08_009152 [Elysia chlorotica]
MVHSVMTCQGRQHHHQTPLPALLPPPAIGHPSPGVFRRLRDPYRTTTKLPFLPYLLLLLSVTLLPGSSDAYVTRIEQCEPIEIPRCRAMPYNMTQMPNLVHHNTQQNARLVFQRFEELIDRRCSDVLLFLLCAIYVPICPVSLLQRDPIPPCRDVCERAKQGCEPVMNAYNVSWSDAFFDCSRLPWYERGVCVIPEAIVQKSDRAGDKHNQDHQENQQTQQQHQQQQQQQKKSTVTDGAVLVPTQRQEGPKSKFELSS